MTSSRLLFRLSVPGGGTVAAAGLLAGLVLSGWPRSLVSGPPDDDLPAIRQILLRPDQLPAELDRVRRGVLRQLPRTEFDALIGAAAAAVAGHEAPRWVEARYQATLIGESLAGTATWEFLHRGPVPGLLPLNPLDIALRRAKWEDGSPAVIGDLDARAPGHGIELLVGRAGEQTLTVEWSARGVPEPGGVRFDLRVPACPVAVLELDLPADRQPAVPRDEGLVTGPVPARAADRRAWRIAFAGSKQIGLTVQPAAGVGPPPLVLARQRTRQELTPGQTASEFTFDLEMPRGSGHELTVELGPGLRPVDVTIRNLERWEWRPGAAADSPPTVVVRLREPLQAGSLTVRAVAPAAPDGRWTSPAATLRGAVSRGETLTVRVHPDLALHDWKAGAFRLADSAVSPDRWQALTLQNGLIRTGTGRPAAVVRPTGTEYRVRERLWCHVDAPRMTLTAELAFDVVRGPVFRVPVQLPIGWELERVESEPPDLLGITGLAPAIATQGYIEFHRPLNPGAEARLILHMSRPWTGASTAGDAVALPDVLPLGARSREGRLAILVAARFRSAVVGAVVEAPGPAADERAPWGNSAADFAVPLRSTAADGVLHIWSEQARVRARVATAVRMAGGRATVDCRVRLEPDGGGPEDVVLLVSGPSGVGWDWQAAAGPNRVRSVQRVAVAPLVSAALATSPWTALASIGLSADPAGSWWRVSLARPLTEPVELQGRPGGELIGTGGVPLTVPLVRVLAAGSMDHQVTLDLRAAPGWQASPVGLADVPVAGGSARLRTLRYGGGPAELTLVPGDGETGAVLDRARLVTFATAPGRLVHLLRFRVWDWDRPAVPVDLPADAAVRQVRVNGAVARLLTAEMAAPEFHVEVPAPAGARSLAVEVVYTTHGRSGGEFAGELIGRLSAAAPRLPGGAGRLSRIWCLPTAEVPVNARGWRTVPSDDDSWAGTPDEGLMPTDVARGTLWEPADADVVGDVLWVARERATAIAGGFMAAVGLFLAWGVRGWPVRRQWVGLLMWLTVAAAGVAWLPAPLAPLARWPLLAGVVLAGWRLVPTPPRSTPDGHRPRLTVARVLPVGVLAVAWLLPAGRAAAPAPTIVYLVAGPVDAPEPRSVLAPPELLDRLRAMDRRRPAGLDGAAWLDARYDGRVTDGQAEFSAVLRLHAFADDPPPVVLPLTGVQLRAATLDGAAAPLRAAGDHYLVPVRGRGPHTLELAFGVPVTGSGDDREIRFGIPELAMSRLTLLAPAGAAHVNALSWRGAQQVDGDGSRPHLDVDLGRAGAAHVSWKVERRVPRPATVRSQEAYLWDLKASAARLLGCVRFAIGPGTVSNLTIDVPKDLEVVTVAARPLDELPGGPPLPAAPGRGWLRGWRVGPAGPARRPLVLDFARPIRGAWSVTLELVPREPFAAAFGLPLPMVTGGQGAPPVFAWRAEGIDFTDERPAPAVSLPPEVFLNEHWIPTNVETDARPPAKAYQRTSWGAAPAMRLRAVPASRERATTTVEWRLETQRAEVEATAHVTAGRDRMALVEWDVSVAVNISDVRGPDVRGWSRTGPRLQIWMTRPVVETTVRVSGAVGRPSDSARFDPPMVRPRAVADGGTLRVTARDGLALTPVLATNLTEVAAPPVGGRERAYSTGPLAYRAAFQVRPAGGTTDFRVHTEAAVRAGRLVAATTIDGQVRRGELRSFAVSIRRGDGWDFRVDAPGGARVRETTTGPQVRSWVVDLPPGVTAAYRAAVIGDRPADPAADVAVPDVTVSVGGPRPNEVQRTVAVATPEVQPRDVVALRPLPGRPGWQVTGDEWRLTLRSFGPRSPAGEPVRVELTDVAVARADDGRWVYRAEVWLAQGAAADLRATWPSPVHVRAVAVDGGSLPPPGGAADSLVVPLPSRTGVRLLQMVWTGNVDSGPPTVSELPVFAVAGGPVPTGPALWTVVTPPGNGRRFDRAPLSAAAAALYRAAAQVRLADMARTDGPQVAAARARVATELRRAEAAGADGADDPTGPNGITLAEWRQQLADVVRPAAESTSSTDDGAELPFDDTFASGDRSTWLVSPGDDGPRLTWSAAESGDGVRLLRTAAVVVAAGLGVWLARRFGRRIWPEQLALLGAAAWAADGGVLWLAPVAVGVAVRLVLLARTLIGRWWPRPQVDQSAGPSAG